jgi:hypothetical protein
VARFRNVHDQLAKSLSSEEAAVLEQLTKNDHDRDAFDRIILNAPRTFGTKLRAALKDEYAKCKWL